MERLKSIEDIYKSHKTIEEAFIEIMKRFKETKKPDTFFVPELPEFNPLYKLLKKELDKKEKV